MIGGEVVVITGASAGVGRATAEAFARRGARVGLIARGIQRLELAAEAVERLGGEARICAADVADADALDWAADEMERGFGPIDIWVNNAMASVLSPVIEMKPSEYERVLSVTYLGAVYGTLAALKRMLARNRGTIIQVGSALAYRSIPLQSAYCAAKHAVVGFTDSLRTELLHEGRRVRVGIVHLPALNTPQFAWMRNRLPRAARPVPPIYQPEVAAEAIYWAAHHNRRELFVGGPTLEAVLGQKLIPGWLDRYLARTGYEMQQSREPKDPHQPDNLWSPAPGAYGARGRFGSQALASSWETWVSEHRGWFLGAGFLAAGAYLARRFHRRAAAP